MILEMGVFPKIFAALLILLSIGTVKTIVLIRAVNYFTHTSLIY
jgi:hypothetical protein